ncbi:MAG: succinate dehydrogenase/fumarate reductase iron-sulfur subunit [Candidatus Melainabacteria bacterium]|nr:succinate dehydrogenase/fumarate reductase iron-sulfur subunit [Candidatus Melainabacteria bacterium]
MSQAAAGQQSFTLRVFRGEPDEAGHSTGSMTDYKVPLGDGMVVLDAVHHVQAQYDPSLAVRWNCKAAKCGSCSAEVNGKPSLMCKTRLDSLPLDEPVVVKPMRAFPLIRDLVTDVSWNYSVNQNIKPFTPANENVAQWDVKQEDVDRAQEFRKCIECFLCQDVCHVLRNHNQFAQFAGPRFMVRLASLEMHPMDAADRIPDIKERFGVGFCNITKCCTEVCPEEIHITDNAIIPLKERVVDRYYDPVMGFIRKLRGG